MTASTVPAGYEALTKNALRIGRKADAARRTLGAVVRANDTLLSRRD